MRKSYINRLCIQPVGRSIPSFRQMIEIEKLVWSEYKKELKSKNLKKAFDNLFDNTKLYTMNLSFANRPIPIEPIMMGMMFHHYKTLVDIENSNTSKEPLAKEIVTLQIYEPYSKELFDKTCDKWKGLINSLRENDREVMLNMLSNCCEGLSEGAAKTIVEKDSEKSLSLYFFFCLIMQNQKLIDRVKSLDLNKENIRASDTLLDFVD